MVARHTKIQGEPETEVLKKKVRRSAPVVEVEDVSSAEEDSFAVAGNPASPRKSRKPRAAPKKKEKLTVEQRLDKLSKRYTETLQDAFRELNTEIDDQDFEVSATAALGDSPGELWAFCTLSVKEIKVCAISVPIMDYPYDVAYLAGVLYLMMDHIGSRFADFRGI